MGSQRRWQVILLVCCVSLSGFTLAISESYDPGLLDDYVRRYATEKIHRRRTGVLYNIPLPANFSGVEAAFLRLRTRGFWLRGSNYSSFHIPPGLLPFPFVRRLYLVYQNLGNWSSYYYKLPNYTLVAPVVGFMVYNATNPSTISNQTIGFCCSKRPILVRFRRISLPENRNATADVKCVRFGPNGVVELSNITGANTCITRDGGHFSIAVASSSPPSKKKERFWKWWVIGFGVGIGGLVLMAWVGIMLWKFVRKKKMREMERNAERSEGLGTRWVGKSRLPTALEMRTQPVLEHDFVP